LVKEKEVKPPHSEAVHGEAREMEAVQQVQKEGVATMKALVALKESLEKSGQGQ